MAELAHAIPPGEDLTPSSAQVDAARLVVAGRTHDADTLRGLLSALGLLDDA
ncbi:hypothetical protein [Nocardiopsis salina]|uniref:hypothetical protein n=1 Tax=Nocardiopsis salina TaxID=245836 RepID=UPI000345E8CF|nr:hypothetical protein [Nocardiopsis salina]